MNGWIAVPATLCRFDLKYSLPWMTSPSIEAKDLSAPQADE
jgi:hypothetical protein